MLSPSDSQFTRIRTVLQSVPAIEEEFESWLESLKATVHKVTVREDTAEGGAR